MSIKVIEGNKPCREGKFAIVVSRFNSLICERLVEGAVDVLKREGEVPEENITLVRVPGAIEIPVVCEKNCTVSKVRCYHRFRLCNSWFNLSL